MTQPNVGLRPHFKRGLCLLALWLPGGALSAQTPAESALTTLSPVFLGEEDGSMLSSFLRGTEFGGYVQAAYTHNFRRNQVFPVGLAGGLENTGRVFDTRHGEFMLNSVLFDINRPTSKENLIGFQVTPLIGDDARVINAVGVAIGGGGADIFGADDFTLINANVRARVPDDIALLGGTEFILGRFVTTTGAEVIPATDNDFYSRSLLFGFAIPLTHTGVLAVTPWVKHDDGNPIISTELGWVNGWDVIHDNNNGGTLMTGVVLTPDPEGWFSLGVRGLWGPEQPLTGAPGPNSNYRTLLDVVAMLKMPSALTEEEGMGFLSGFKLLLNFDWAGEEGAGPTGGYANWYGFGGIVRFDFDPLGNGTNNWFVAYRGEYFDDDDGVRFGTGVRTDVWQMSWALGYYPLPSLLLRGEFRYDKAPLALFSDATKSYQTTLAFDAIVSF
jgi:hypothetical protein